MLAIAMAFVVSPVAAKKNSSVAQEQRFEGCREKLKAAQKLGLLKGMSFDNGKPKVVIGPTWYRIDFDAKTGFAETAACFFLGGDQKNFITFPIYDNMSGKVVARWKFNKLEVQ